MTSEPNSKSLFGGPLHAADDTEDDPASPGQSKVSTTSPAKLANGNVAPFLTRHIPEQYAPLGPRPDESQPSSANSRYCYRHRPDLKCRRQADEPSMEQLQRVWSTLNSSS